MKKLKSQSEIGKESIKRGQGREGRNTEGQMLTFRDLILSTTSSNAPLEEICRLRGSDIFNSFKVECF